MLSSVKQSLNIPEDDFIGIFLYGSQNYHLDTEDSDVDTIVLVHSADKPRKELVTPIGKTKIYTIKYFIDRLKQGDLECYEILYTKYRIVKPDYNDILNEFVSKFSKVMSYERIKRSLLIKLYEHLSHALWIPRTDENARYNKKRLYWSMRVYNQLERILDGESFEASLVYISSLGHDLVKIKTIPNYLSLREFNEMYKLLVEFHDSSPRYLNAIIDEEDACLSDFYNNITMKLNNKGGDSP